MATQPGSKVPLAGIPFPVVTMMSCIGKPRGHGTIHFPSADSHASPVIDSKLLDHPDDLERAVDATLFMWELARTEPLSKLAFPLFPGRRTYRDRERVRAHVPFACGSGYHPCGTIPMSAE